MDVTSVKEILIVLNCGTCKLMYDKTSLTQDQKFQLGPLLKMSRQGFKKRHELGTLSQEGGGGLTPQIQCPNLLKCFDTKID